MSIIIPPVFTGIHTEEIKNNTPSQEETKRKIVHDVNYLGNLIPMGKILIWAENQIGVGILDDLAWQRANGTEIINPLSPLRSIGINQNFTPILTEDRFIRGAINKTSNTKAGTNFFQLAHDHFGTQQAGPGGLIYEEDEGEGSRRVDAAHSHNINSDLSNNFFIDHPKNLKVAAFMKIS